MTTVLFEENLDLNKLFNLNVTYNFDLLKNVVEAVILGYRGLEEKIKSSSETVASNDNKIYKVENDLKEFSSNSNKKIQQALNDIIELQSKEKDTFNKFQEMDETIASLKEKIKYLLEKKSDTNLKNSSDNVGESEKLKAQAQAQEKEKEKEKSNEAKSIPKKNSDNISNKSYDSNISEDNNSYDNNKNPSNKTKKKTQSVIANIAKKSSLKQPGKNIHPSKSTEDVLLKIKGDVKGKGNIEGDLNESEIFSEFSSKKIRHAATIKNRTEFPSFIGSQYNEIAGPQKEEQILKLEEIMKSKIEDVKDLNGKNILQIQKLQNLISNLGSNLSSAQKKINYQKDQITKLNEKQQLLLNLIPKINQMEYTVSSMEDLNEVKISINTMKNQIKDFGNNQNEMNEKLHLNFTNSSTNRNRINEISSVLSTVRASVEQIQTACASFLNHPIDITKYVHINTFNDYKKNTLDKLLQNSNNISLLDKAIQNLEAALKTKVSDKDLKALKEYILGKLEEFGGACNKKFADNFEMTKMFKMVEQNIKNLSKEINKRDKGESWLLAKKPLNGYTCASCEAYIGNLKESNQYVPWNKYPLREGDTKYRNGNGYSKMLQLLNSTGGNAIDIELNQVMSNTAKAFPRIKLRKNNSEVNIKEPEKNDKKNGDEFVANNQQKEMLSSSMDNIREEEAP